MCVCDEVVLEPLAKRRRSQRRRRRLAFDRRAEFDLGVLDGKQVDDLAKAFGLEPWYAARRAKRVQVRAEREAAAALPPPLPVLAPEDMTPLEYACSLLGPRVMPMPRGYYALDGFPVGPKEVVRAANDILRSNQWDLIPYPGLVPLPAGR